MPLPFLLQGESCNRCMVYDYCISIYLPGNPESNSNNIESVRPWLSDPIQLSAILEIDFSLNPLPDEILFIVGEPNATRYK